MKNRKTLILLAVALAIVLLGSGLASVFNTGSGATTVSRISFDAEHGKLSGLLYMPKGASAQDPRPTVIVTHGYLNSAEMQDANAIELSRRGYVVLALDMYDHGHSKLDPENYKTFEAFGSFLATWAPFWNYSMTDAVAYMYEQPYVLKDEIGNGIIGVTGHSMGGFSSAMALCNDELEYQATGIRKIYCGLTEGADFSYTGMFGFDAATADLLGGGRILGKVAAQYDEFFFSAPDDPAGTVRHKNYVGTPDGQTFLQTADAQPGVWYATSDGGMRIIYQPAETHPWNHFSTETTKNAIDFYTTAFAAYPVSGSEIASGNQMWVWKEAFECLALVGFVLFIIALAKLLADCLPFAKAELKPAPSKKGKAAVLNALVLIAVVALMALIYSPVSDGNPADVWMWVLFGVSIAVAVASLFFGLLAMKKKDTRKTAAAVIALVAGAATAILSRKADVLYTAAQWTAPGVNPVAAWTLICAALVLTVLAFMALVGKETPKLSSYGVVLKGGPIVGGLIIAFVTVVVSYALLFLVDGIFKTDFRIWVFAFKTFDAGITKAVLRYLPTFLLFYLVSAASITVNTNTEKLQGVKGYLAAIALNAGDAILWLAVQYIVLFSTGVAAIPGAALSGIVLVATCLTLVMTACIARALYKKTGSIWAPAFINGLIVTIMTIANTTVYFK